MSSSRFAEFQALDIAQDGPEDSTLPVFGSRASARANPKTEFPKSSLQPRTAAQIVIDMHQLDANPRLDLGSFCTTFMDKEAEEVIAATQAINLVDSAQYPQCVEMDNRCCNMLADLWHAPKARTDKKEEQPLGTSTIGSSEACMLGGLALKRSWREARKAAGKPTDKPNLVLGINAQVCWEKFCEYFEVEARYVPVTEEVPVMHPDKARSFIDENTIGFVCMFASTYNGQFEDVEATDKMISEVNKEKGLNVRIHVDGASGGFVAPFVYPDLKFDFRLPNVVSINTSGHKYGLVYPGVGWIIWRNRGCVHDSLLFHVAYLGTDQVSLQLNFSKNANMVAAQYYQILRLGFEGYKAIMTNLMKISGHLQDGILETGHFKLIGSGKGLPVVAFALKAGRKDANGNDIKYDEFDVMDKLRQFHWELPAYNLPKAAEHQKMLRVVVREDLTYEMASILVTDIKKSIEWLDHHFIYTDEQLDTIRKKFHPNHPRHAAHKKHVSPNNKKRAAVC